MIRLRLERAHLRALLRGKIATMRAERWPSVETEDVQIMLADIGFDVIMVELLDAIRAVKPGGEDMP